MCTKKPLMQVYCGQSTLLCQSQVSTRSSRAALVHRVDLRRASMCGGDDLHAKIILQDHRARSVLNITVQCKTGPQDDAKTALARPKSQGCLALGSNRARLFNVTTITVS